MDDKRTLIEELNLPNRYKNALIRYGIKYIEELDAYFSDEDAAPFSSRILHFGVKGDYLLADALEFYHFGRHLDEPEHLVPVTLKNDDEIRIIDIYRMLNPQDKQRVMEYMLSYMQNAPGRQPEDKHGENH